MRRPVGERSIRERSGYSSRERLDPGESSRPSRAARIEGTGWAAGYMWAPTVSKGCAPIAVNDVATNATMPGISCHFIRTQIEESGAGLPR